MLELVVGGVGVLQAVFYGGVVGGALLAGFVADGLCGVRGVADAVSQRRFHAGFPKANFAPFLCYCSAADGVFTLRMGGLLRVILAYIPGFSGLVVCSCLRVSGEVGGQAFQRLVGDVGPGVRYGVRVLGVALP